MERERSRESDTTSGCETGQSSDQAQSVDSFQRRDSGSSGSQDTDTDTGDAAGDNIDLTDNDKNNQLDNFALSTPVGGYSKVVNNDSVASGPTPGYINTAPAQTSPDPVKPSNGYIQLPAKPSPAPVAPVSNGCIQI